MTPEPSEKQYPEVLFKSSCDLSQSLFVKPRSFKLEHFLKNTPKEIVLYMYLKMHFAALRWFLVGMCINLDKTLVAYIMPSLVIDKYNKESIMLLKIEGSINSEPSLDFSFNP